MKKKTVETVSDTAHDLAEDIRIDLANLRDDARRLATDYLAPAARDLADYVQPRAQDLGRRGVQFATEARDTLSPKVAQFASDARENLSPLIEDARDRLQPRLDEAYRRVAPTVTEAMAHVQPLVDSGRERFNEEVLPHLNEALDNLAARPEAKDALDRLTAARAALIGELTLPAAAEVVSEAPAKRSIGKTIFKLLLATGLLAGVAYALKRFLAPEDSGWQAHEPSAAYRQESTATSFVDTPAATETAEEEADMATEAVDEAATAGDETSGRWGPGSYVGTEPGADFVIKGNDRSMKYHVQGGGGYERTIADVWFNSEEAAQAAGFTRAQR